MAGIEHFEAYLMTAFLFIMTPGIDTVFVLNKSIGQGKKAGVYATLGVNGGIVVHTIFAALGLSIIIAKSATAFMIIKYLGAAYLLYLGISKILSKTKVTIDEAQATHRSSQQHFVSGLISNLFNPKVALFFLSFFPQFIKPEAVTSPTPFIILGLTFALLGVIWFLVLTYFSATFSRAMKNNQKFNNWLNKISGMVYILMGVKIALSKK